MSIAYIKLKLLTVVFMESKQDDSKNNPKVTSLTLSNGQKIPAVGLGTAFKIKKINEKDQVDEIEVKTIIKAAVEAGFRHFDCAYAYLSEEAVGAALNEKIKEGVVKREDLFIISKVWIADNAKEDVPKACKKSLKAMGLDYFDSYLVHWPFSEKNDTDYLETWKGMEESLNLNLTRSIGVSNFNITQLKRLMKNSNTKPVINQVEVHINFNQNVMREFCAKNNIVVVAYSPIGSPGRDSSWQLPSNVKVKIDEIPEITTIAKKYEKTNYQVALRYLIDSKVIPIPKTSSVRHLRDNINLFDFILTDKEIKELDALNKNLRTNPAIPYKNFTNYPFVEFERPENID